MTSNCKCLLVFELSGATLVPKPNFGSLSLQIADFSLSLGPYSVAVYNFAAMATAQNVTNWFDLQYVS